jgi:hypothetical protein
MVTTFCLRLALGMVAPMMILPAAIVPPRFFRVQFLSALALLVIAGVFHVSFTVDWGPGLLAAAAIACALGSIVWHTDEAPLGRILFFVATVFIAAAMVMTRSASVSAENLAELIADDFASASTLGAAISAMLMGHSYLIAPAMSLSPLNRLLVLLAGALAFRAALACWGLYRWTRLDSGGSLDRETIMWLVARWLLGLGIPMVLTWMAWETARIRSTQSATGILYVVTIVVFLGELLSLLLAEKIGFPM